MTHAPPLTANAARAAALLAGQPPPAAAQPAGALPNFAGLLLALGASSLPASAAPSLAAPNPVAPAGAPAVAGDKVVKRVNPPHGPAVAKPVAVQADVASAAPVQPVAVAPPAPSSPAAPIAAPQAVTGAAEPPIPVPPAPSRPGAPDLPVATQASLPAIAAPTPEPVGANAAATPATVEPAIAPPAVPAAPREAEPAVAAATPAGPASATRQVAPVLVQVAHAPAGTAVTVRLDPAELGHVVVRIERAADGSSAVQVAVERPETLRALLADQTNLHRALDSAGLAPDSRSLTLSLSSPNEGASATSGSGLGPNLGGSGQPGGQGGYRPGRSAATSGELDTAGVPLAAAWQRAGVDITA